MVYISFLLGCRDCFQTDALRYNYNLTNKSSTVYNKMTEFELVTIIESWRGQNGDICSFCGSSNVEVYDVEVDSYRLFDVDRLSNESLYSGGSLIYVDIIKKGRETSLNIAFDKAYHPDFLKAAIFKIIDTVNTLPNKYFVEQIKGNFDICLTGFFDNELGKVILKLERFMNVGITRKEILCALKSICENENMNISINGCDSIKGKSIFFTKKFKGSMFISSIYATYEEQEKGLPFSCVAFDFDENVIIACDTNGKSPQDFIAENKNTIYVVDDEQPYLTWQNKVVFFAKKI